MANIKRNKGIKGPTIAICAVATVALVGVGFAAWVISGSSSASTTGNIQVDVVNDTSYPIVLNGWQDGKDSIVFGIPAGSENVGTDTTSSDFLHATWLTTTTSNSDGAGEYENLEVTLNFNVYNVKAGDDLSSILDVDFTTTTTTYTDLESYTKGYVSGLPNKADGTLKLSYQAGGAESNYTEITSSNSVTESDIQTETEGNNPGNYVACQATATFSWGPAFAGMNPYYFSYYVEGYENDATASNSVIDSSYFESASSDSYTTITSQLLFSQALQQLETDFGTGIEFTLTITAAANS